MACILNNRHIMILRLRNMVGQQLWPDVSWREGILAWVHLIVNTEGRACVLGWEELGPMSKTSLEMCRYMDKTKEVCLSEP